MAGKLRIVHRTILGFILLGTLMLGFSALNHYSDASVLSRVLKIVFVAILVAGLIPGSYIHRFVGKIGADSPERSILVVLISAVIVPFVLVVLFVLAALDRAYMNRLVGELNLRFLNPSEISFFLVQFLALAIVSGILLVVNTIDLIKARDSSPAT